VPVRAILFDLFDTLVDLYMDRLPESSVGGRRVNYTYPALHAEILRHADVEFESFTRHLADVDRGLRASQAEGREVSTRARFRELAERLGLDVPGLPESLTRVHMGALRGVAYAPPHHDRVMESLRRGYRLAVCSNFSDTRTALDVLEEARLLRHFDAAVISEDVGWRKPRPEIFRACLERLDVAPEETLHVGDRLIEDVGGAGGLGLRTCWLTRRVADPEAALRDHAGPPPTLVVADLADLPEQLRGL
jgi:putative hydrolase of the HAD superfamily